MKLETKYCGLTDVGRRRQKNEDNFLADSGLGLYVVCDGMGGHAAGHMASKIAVQVFHNEVFQAQDTIQNYLNGQGNTSKQDILNLLTFAADRASSEVHSQSLSNSEWSGMGTTLVSVLIAGTEAFVLNVGDSRAYLLRRQSLEQITTDHTVFNELIKSGRLPLAQAEKLGVANSITRAIGTSEYAHPETLVIDLLDGDRFLLCSDGLSHYFEQETGILAELLSIPDLELATQTMIDAANEAGGADNITAIIVSIRAEGQADSLRAQTLQLKRDFLSRMPLFNQLNERELLHVLQATEVVSFEVGQTIISEGAEGTSLFVLLQGQASVKTGGKELAVLIPGDHFGEMALLRGEPCPASVVSNDASQLMVIRREEFFETLGREQQLTAKLLRQFLGVMPKRFAGTKQQPSAAKEALPNESPPQRTASQKTKP